MVRFTSFDLPGGCGSGQSARWPRVGQARGPAAGIPPLQHCCYNDGQLNRVIDHPVDSSSGERHECLGKGVGQAIEHGTSPKMEQWNP